jgi:DNA-directed RNA polymerase specialized sigma24 family protein
LYGAVDYAIRDHLRARYGRAPTLDTDGALPRPSKRELHSAADALDPERQKFAVERMLGVTTHLTVLEIFAYVEAAFKAEEVRALRLHDVEDRSLSELAAALGLVDEAAAERLLRRLKARLRKRFAGGP